MQFVARSEPGFVEGMIVGRDCFWEVRLFHNGMEKGVLVDFMFPVERGGPAFVRPVVEAGVACVWPMVVEKAMAKMYATY
jgi:hypothetical protein